MSMPELVTAAEVARRLGLKARTVYALARLAQAVGTIGKKRA